MADKPRSAAPHEAQQVFRQFAWNIAGTLAGQKSATPTPRKPRRVAARREAAAK
ncbi:MAG: hypothetical protein KKH72_07640 [Alphaproteobacteria bacterium]|nr:hypothetical protein [Alphaproteobacteria bacterium]